MKDKRFLITATVILTAGFGSYLWAHCQVPCGIYGDSGRFDTLLEHVQTVEKSMNQIAELSKESGKNYNQIVRWVNNKEKHADEIAEIVTYYFMAQRVKPTPKTDKAAYEKYVGQLTLLHGILVNAMKAKQTTDLEYCEKLRAGILEFKEEYAAK